MRTLNEIYIEVYAEYYPKVKSTFGIMQETNRRWLRQKLIKNDLDEYSVWEEYYNEIINKLLGEL